MDIDPNIKANPKSGMKMDIVHSKPAPA